MLRQALLALSASNQARDLIMATPVTRDVVARFVAGETAADALRVCRRLIAGGLLVSIDFLGEDTTDPEQAAAVADEYIRLLGQLSASGLAAHGRAEVSVKPTAVGLGLAEHGEKTALENIARIATAARNAGTTVTLDMEDHSRVEATLGWSASCARTSPTSAASSSPTCAAARTTAGPWRWPARGSGCARALTRRRTSVGLASRAEVDRSYARCMRILLDGPGYPMLATHDPRLIRIAGGEGGAGGRAAGSFEYQMLYGIRPAEQARLAGGGRAGPRLPAVWQRLVRLPGPAAGRAAGEPGVLPPGAGLPALAPARTPRPLPR